MLTLLPLILRNVFRNRRRSLLTMGSAAVSLGILALFMGLYQSFYLDGPRDASEAARVIVRHKVSLTQSLPSSYLDRLRSVDGVAHVSPWTWFGGVYKEPKNFFARFGVDPETIFLVHGDWTIPPRQLDAFKRSRTACVAGQALVDKFGWKLGERITLIGDIYPVKLELTLAGIFQHPPQNEALIFHREYLRELLPPSSSARDSVGTFLLQARAPDDVPLVSRAIDMQFANSPYPTRTESVKEFQRSFLAFLGNVKLFMAAICSAVTFTILLVSANTVAMAVRERTREMAILRTLGFSPGEILQLVLGESMVISVVGGVIGLGVAWLLSSASQRAPGGFPIYLKWEAAELTLAIAATVGLVSALVPAVLASRKNIVESLRFTG